MAKKAAGSKAGLYKAPTPARAAVPPPPVKPPEPPRVEPPREPERNSYRHFDHYVQDYPEAKPLRMRLAVDDFPRHTIFPVDKGISQTLPGGYYWANYNGFEPGTFKDASRPLFYLTIYDGSDTMRKWCFTESECQEGLEELAVLMPSTIEELNQMGFKKEV